MLLKVFVLLFSTPSTIHSFTPKFLTHLTFVIIISNNFVSLNIKIVIILRVVIAFIAYSVLRISNELVELNFMVEHSLSRLLKYYIRY